MTNERERFWNNVKRGDKNDCWLWLGGKTKSGYGQCYFEKKVQRAHRVAWMLSKSIVPIPSGMGVLHTCDNPACVNPLHLFLGTQKDNMQDCKSKGRMNNIGQPNLRYTLRTHCNYGHPFSGENLVMRRDGYRACRTCIKKWQAERKLGHATR